jgi:hypothetical protein
MCSSGFAFRLSVAAAKATSRHAESWIASHTRSGLTVKANKTTVLITGGGIRRGHEEDSRYRL